MKNTVDIKTPLLVKHGYLIDRYRAACAIHLKTSNLSNKGIKNIMYA